MKIEMNLVGFFIQIFYQMSRSMYIDFNGQISSTWLMMNHTTSFFAFSAEILS